MTLILWFNIIRIINDLLFLSNNKACLIVYLILYLIVIILKVIVKEETYIRITIITEIQDDYTLNEIIKERKNKLDLIYIIIFIYKDNILI